MNYSFITHNNTYFMRRNQKKGPYYKELLQSPTQARYRLPSLDTTRSLQEIRSNKLSNYSNAVNMIRLGSPSETLIHLPKKLNILKKSASYSLTRPGESLERVISKISKVDIKDVRIKSEILDKINSLEMNVASFDEYVKYRPNKVMTKFELMRNREYLNDFSNKIRDRYNLTPEFLRMPQINEEHIFESSSRCLSPHRIESPSS